MGGTASGLQRQVTYIEKWMSREEPAAVVAMSWSIGLNHSMQPVTSNKYTSLITHESRSMRTERLDTPYKLYPPRLLTTSSTELDAPPDDIIKHTDRKRSTRPSSNEHHALIITQINTTSTIRAVKHHMHRNTTVLRALLAARDALLLASGILVQSSRPITAHTRR